MGQQWENLSLFSGFSLPLPASSSNRVHNLQAAGNLCVHWQNYNRANRKFGNIRMSTNILIRGREEDGCGCHKDGSQGLALGTPALGESPFTARGLICRAHSTLNALACHFHDQVTTNHCDFQLRLFLPQLPQWEELAARLLGLSGASGEGHQMRHWGPASR